ncbi:MAG: hypothetical protein ACRDZO_20300 [Egibacteraceae bacterium]
MRVTFATCPQPGKAGAEDLCGAVGDLAWVLDGASVPAELSRCCDLDARWYVTRLSAALLDAFTTSPAQDLGKLLACAIAKSADEHHSACHDAADESLAPSATVALARRRVDALDYLVLGDAAVLLEAADGVRFHTDDRLAQVRPDLRNEIRAKLAAGMGFDSPVYQSLLVELVRHERAARNQPGGYWIASQNPDAAFEAVQGTARIGEGAGAVRRVGLLTDGARRAVTPLGVYCSWDALMRALVTEGPARCIDAIRAAETGDPDGRRFPRSKPSDDATALVWHLID